MKTKFRIGSRRLLGACAVALVPLLAGCLEDRIAWSPDGSRALVRTTGGDLYLCGADGHLSGKFASDIGLMAWLGGSGRVVLTRESKTSAWAEIAPLLGALRSQIEAQAEQARADLASGVKWSAIEARSRGRGQLLKIFLRERYGDEIQPKLTSEEWHGFRPEHTSVTRTEIVTAQIAGDRLALEPVVYTKIGEITDLRPSPDGQAIVWTDTLPDNTDVGVLELLSLRSGSSGPTVIARAVAVFSDWSPDGRSVVYLQTQPEPAGKVDGIALGVLARRTVLDTEGKVALTESPEYLAAGLFNGFTRIRCLPDGRILFNAVEMGFPIAMPELDGDHREQLFVADPKRSPTLSRLIPRGRELDVPQMLAFFDVSPDGSQVLFGGIKGETVLLTLATGEVKRIQDTAKDTFQGRPVWRRAGELTYVKRMSEKDANSARPAEIVLRRGDQETILSESWPADVLAEIASHDRQ